MDMVYGVDNDTRKVLLEIISPADVLLLGRPEIKRVVGEVLSRHFELGKKQ